MKKIMSAAALSVLTAVFVSGCAGAPAPSATPSAAAVVAPSKEQQASLLAEFRKVAPAVDEIRSVQEARRTCHLILHGGPEATQIESAKQLLSDAGTAPSGVTDSAAKKIIDVIKANGFCTPPA